jgi:hypothetical protein
MALDHYRVVKNMLISYDKEPVVSLIEANSLQNPVYSGFIVIIASLN